MINNKQLKIFVIWIIIIILVYIIYLYLDTGIKKRDMFQDSKNDKNNYIVINTKDDIESLSKDFKGSINFYKPDLYLKMKGEKKFDLDNYF